MQQDVHVSWPVCVQGAGDYVYIGGQLNDKRIYKFVSAEWDIESGECYAFVQAPVGLPLPVRVLANGISKVPYNEVVKRRSKL